MNLSGITPTRLRLILSVLLVCWFSLGMASAQTPEVTETPEATETPEPKTDVNGYQLTFDVEPSHGGSTIDDLRAAAEVIVRRLEALDVALFQVQIVNQSSIQVQFPGAEDPQAITEDLTEIALLEIVDFTGLNDKAVQFEGLNIQTTARESVAEGQVNPLTGDPFATVLTGADLKDAHAEVASYDPNQWTIVFELTPEAGKIFGDYTESHIGEPLAIVLDGQVLTAPIIQSRLDTQGVISGNFTQVEAESLAAQLRAGALPLSLTVTSMATVETILIEIPAEDAAVTEESR